MHFRPLLALTFLLGTAPVAVAQRPPAQPNAAEILHKMQKLNVLGSVLYIVAHPDDENTRLIAWLANGKKVRTGNLSLTRGDGGQNLIGPELGDALGIIRTQELLEARRIDGGEQFFTRAVDFGYSKSAAESFEKWGKQEVLSDVVRVIRMFRPDIIITRFAPDRSAGHGHHEASAILAEEAFDLAGDPKAFPEQLQQGLEVWQPRRLLFNGSTWWKKDLADIAKNDPDWFSVDVGGYDPLLGLSYTEIAGRSRSMHKSQGFGAAETRGELLEYLKFIKGDRPKTKDIFEGIDMTWGDLGEQRIGLAIDSLVDSFDPKHPEASLPRLYRMRGESDPLLANEVLRILGNSPGDTSEALSAIRRTSQGKQALLARRWDKHEALDPLILACAGISFEGLCDQPYISTSGRIVVSGLLRTASKGIRFQGAALAGEISSNVNDELIQNQVSRDTIEFRTDQIRRAGSCCEGANKGRTAYLYEAMSPAERVSASLESWLFLSYGFSAGQNRFFGGFSRPYYKWVDRVDGERIRPVYVTPVASVIPRTDVLIARGGPQEVVVEVEALTDSLVGQVNVTLPEGWATTKDLKLVNIAKRNERQRFTYQLIPGANAKAGAVKFEFSGPKGKADRTLHEIDYPHIMPQVYYTPAEVKLVPLDVKATAKRVGYIKGAGDDVPQAMEQLGVVVEFIEPASAKLEELRKYDAIVTGIRAYNATKGMKELHPLLLQYAEQGGTLIVQYNTTPRFFSGASDFQIDPATLGPHPFTISRGRVTVEEAPPTFLDPKHPLLNTPNTITAADFDGWVQERGLYFASDFGTHYTPLIAWNDPGEDPLTGGLITCDWGKGRYVYTGISFFRQLPAGVPGAYRLFANLISGRVK
ncbi:MAG: PIG-L family deacetylase [Flavobacteriales bacterium]|nr:MAG: PIG-L family deacetylase [Flavobacteriales bacterium]